MKHPNSPFDTAHTTSYSACAIFEL